MRNIILGVLSLTTAFCVDTFGQDRLDGTAEVSATGGAVYTVQIQTSKGTGDLQPSIALSYNSQSGNGVAGYGCSITGISVITRGMRDIAHDGAAGGVGYDTSDALYLDGKRLISDPAGSGVYSPEGEPFTKVSLHGNPMTVNCWFEVDTNDGMVYEFGRDSNSRQTVTMGASTRVHAWYISKGTNTLGQTITYHYMCPDRYWYPQTISYGDGNSVTFDYEARTDTIHFSLREQKGCIGRRLKSITSKAGSSVYRTYTMTYDSSSDASTTKFSRLTYITETGALGNGSRRITLDWNYQPSYSPSCSSPGITLPEGDNLHEYGERYLMAGDLNGDGVSDIVHLSPVKEYEYKEPGSSKFYSYIYAHIYRSSVTNGNVSFQPPLLCRFPGILPFQDMFVLKGNMCMADIDGDGTGDMILPGCDNAKQNGNISFCLFYTLGKDIVKEMTDNVKMDFSMTNATEMPLYSLTDLDNDCRCDIMVLERQHSNGKYLCHVAHIGKQETIYKISLTLTGTPRKLFTGDYNVDGLVDMLVVCDDGYRIFYNRGGTLSSGLFTDSSTLIRQSEVHHRMEQGDFNGDGIPDFIWNNHDSRDIYFELGNGNGTFTQRLAYTLPYTVYPQNTDEGTWSFQVADLDHDGKSDVVINTASYIYSFMKAYTHWFLSDGQRLILKKTATSKRKDDAKAGHILVGDFKGQGWLDVMNYGYDCWNGSNADTSPSMHLYSSSNQKISDGRVKSVRNSDGRITSFTYGSMASDKLYTKGTGSVYPVVDVAAPLCVVSQTKETGASKVYHYVNYTYKALRAHLQGRGLLGFDEWTTVESFTGKTVTTTVEERDAQRYVPLRTVTATQGSTVAASTATGTVVASGSNYMVYPSSLAETDIYGNTTTTTYNYNTTYGYLTRKRTEYGSSSMYQQVEYDYPANKIGRAYRPGTVILSQRHGDSTQPYGSTTRYTYNSYGLPTQVIEHYNTPTALTTDYAYDRYGNVTRETVSGEGITDPMVTNYQYTDDGRFLRQKTTTPASTTVSYSWNAFGELNAVADVSCVPHVTSYTRDGFGMVTKETKPTGEETTFSRTVNNDGYVVTETRAGGGTVTTQYDALDHELSSETRGIGGIELKTANVYSIKGNLTRRTRQKGTLTVSETMSYDSKGRLQSRTVNGETTSYSYGNRTTTVTDHGRVYMKTYDAWGNVKTSTDPVSSVSYTYHSNGKPSCVESEGATVCMEYDAAGNQTELDDPDAGISTYEYDALGRLILQTDARGNETSYVYDATGKLTSKNCEGVVTVYTYGTSGYGKERLVREQTSDRFIAYEYDNKGRLSSETRGMTGETSATFTYHYDSYGRLSSKDYPQGVTVNYRYDANGNLVGSDVGGHCTGLVSVDNGRTTTILYGGTLSSGTLQVQSPALTHSTAFDSWGHVTGLTLTRNSGNSTLHSMSFNFDGVTDNLLSRTGMTDQQETFVYDDLDRLVRVQKNNATVQELEYADNGNIEGKTGVGTLYYDGQQPHAVSAADNTAGYIPSTSQQATYTAFGKVESLTEGAYGMTFTYGPDGQRWSTELKEGGIIKRRTFYAGDYERVTENGTTRHFIYLDNGSVYVIEGSQPAGSFYCAFTDHLGSVTRIYDESGNSVFEAEYDAWGKQDVTKNTIGFQRGYTGHEMLPEFGLVNMNGRLYDPILGRFLSPDNYVQMPDFSQSFNRYAYCINNPLKYHDPDGEWFGLDDLLVSAVSFVVGYLTNGISTGNWGWSSVQSGLGVALGSWIGYNTAGISNMGNFIAQSSINTIVNTFVPSINIPIGNHFGLSISPSFGLGPGGLSAGLNIGGTYQNDNFSLGTSLGFSSNYYGWFGELGIGNFKIGYGRTSYGSTNAYGENIGAQTVGTVKFGVGDISFALSNDLFGEKNQDRWRTSAAELSIGNFAIGTYVITNDGQHESKLIDKKEPTTNIKAPILGVNKKMKAWKSGKVYAAPFWIGIRNGNQISRIGYNGKIVQTLTQNLVHHYLVSTPDFTDYKLSTPMYTYCGYNNPISIWNF